LLNTLYVTTEGSYLHKDHDTIIIKVEEEKKAQLPLLHLSAIVCLARATMSAELMGACVERGIHVSFFSQMGRFLARVEGVPGGNVLLRRQQFRAADDEKKSLEIARSMVIGKVANTRQFMLHARRDAAEERKASLEEGASRLSLYLRSLTTVQTLNEVRGLEGISAKDYFERFQLLIKGSGFTFHGRSRRPPLDRVNALLSFGYALLMGDCAGAATGVGLDAAVGYLHEERPGRLCLALDLMEELRVPVVDRLVLSMINRGQLKPNDFNEEPSGGIRLKDEARKAFLVAYQEAKQVEVKHEFLAQTIPWGRVPHLQALLLARVIRGDLECYPPFSMK
jgi:CRISP-associated protein Cas1